MDIGTAKDMIEDLQLEIAELRRDIKALEHIAERAFTFSDGHQAGCRMGLMCQCGYMHYLARLDINR